MHLWDNSLLIPIIQETYEEHTITNQAPNAYSIVYLQVLVHAASASLTADHIGVVCSCVCVSSHPNLCARGHVCVYEQIKITQTYMRAIELYPRMSPARSMFPAERRSVEAIRKCNFYASAADQLMYTHLPKRHLLEHSVPSCVVSHPSSHSPASQFSGLSAAGSLSNAMMAWHTHTDTYAHKHTHTLTRITIQWTVRSRITQQRHDGLAHAV